MTKLGRFTLPFFIFAMHYSTQVCADVMIEMYKVAPKGHGQSVGTIQISNARCGVLLQPHLHGLTPGLHGFHIHVNPSCEDNGMAAGGHLDPAKTEAHRGPYSQQGHLGDLPVLIVNKDGTATTPTLAPNFRVSEMIGHSLMIHAGGDNYADTPEKLGGGGQRIICGVISREE